MLYKKTEKLTIIRKEGEIMGMFVNPNAAAFQLSLIHISEPTRH